MSTIAELLQAGQPDLELAAVSTRVLLAPYFGTSPITNIEDATTGGLDAAKVGRGTSPFVTVGNYEKKAGVKLSNKPTANRIMSAGYGSATRIIFSESGKSITYTPQEVNLVNLQNAWGFTPDAVSDPSAKGGITIGIPSLPARMLWRAVLITADVGPSGRPVYMYWIANRAEASDRQDIQAVDSNVFEHGVTLEFQDDQAEGVEDQVIFGICGDGWSDLSASADTGLVDPSAAVVTLGTPSAGTFTLTWRGHTTATIAYNATAATVKTALVALDDNYGSSDWDVTGSAGGPYTITPPAAGPITGNGASLTGGTFSID
jgi:hypothetical protein